MDEYPNSDEEFELMYGDEFEVLKEHEDLEKSPKTSRRSLNFSQNNTVSTPGATNSHDKSFETDFTQIEADENADFNSRKRTVEELFGEIDDILYESQGAAKKHKGSDDSTNQDLALIEHILQLRKLAKDRDNPQISERDYTKNHEERDKNNLSYSVPRYNFIGVTRPDSVRVYVRFHSESYEKEETLRITQEISNRGFMGDTKEIWGQAQAILNKQLEDVDNLQPQNSESQDNKSLWVDLYKPKKYLELLSDESTNRIMLRWLKLWDKVVFKRNPRVRMPVNKSSDSDKWKKFDLNTELDEHGRPQHKIALLCGPPGLGKTTLAHMVARHCGYNVVEVNASDDRSIDVFKTCLENATQMKSVLDKDNRPNCIVFDEIDGAPANSIDFLVKFVQGTAKVKKSAKNQSHIVKRPIICICNDVYVPALRPLRQISFVINFPPTSHTRLAERLMEIARRERIKTDIGAMLALAQKSNNDIRSSLSVLHFFKSENKPVTLSEIHRAKIGEKDMQKGLFSVWQDIFLISSSDKARNPTSKERMSKILDVVNSFGDFERVAQGVFENFPRLEYKSLDLSGTCQALEWFCFNDVLSKTIYSLQNYSLGCYLPFAFVVWHFVFATRSWQKLQYPSAGYEAKMKRARQQAIVAELMRGMQPNIRASVQPIALLLDVIPLIRTIITPNFRPINLHLYTKEERESLEHVVNIMIDYNLNYVQERTPDGTYEYKLDPNIDEIVSFGPKRSLSYANKQLIAKEIETAKMHRLEKTSEGDSAVVKKSPAPLPHQKSNLPNHLQTLRARSVRSVETPAVTKDFFGRIIPKASPEGLGKAGPELKNDIWFQYKEGYSNAVRKKIKIAVLK